jgi:hypothetical protein
MFHLFTGNRPPVKADEVEKISELKGYCGNLLQIIEKSMRYSPAQRYNSAEALTTALDGI